MTIAISDEQIKCHHVFPASNNWRCPKCWLHLQTYNQMLRIQEEVQGDPEFQKLVKQSKNGQNKN